MNTTTDKLDNSKPFELSGVNFDLETLPCGISTFYDNEKNKFIDGFIHNEREFTISQLVDECPELDSRVFSESGDTFTTCILLYKVKCLFFFLGWMKDTKILLLKNLKSYPLKEALVKYLDDISSAGLEPQLVLTAVGRYTRKAQTRDQTYEGLNLTLSEIDELESIREARRLVNLKYENLIVTDEYKLGTDSYKDSVLKQRQRDLKKCSSVLFDIVTLSTQYLTSSERIRLKLDKSLSIDEMLLALKRSQLDKFRNDPLSYTLPKSES